MKVTPRATQAIQKKYALLGIDSNEQHRRYPVNAQSVIAITVFCSCVCSTSGYLICDAKSFREYIG